MTKNIKELADQFKKGVRDHVKSFDVEDFNLTAGFHDYRGLEDAEKLAKELAEGLGVEPIFDFSNRMFEEDSDEVLIFWRIRDPKYSRNVELNVYADGNKEYVKKMLEEKQND